MRNTTDDLQLLEQVGDGCRKAFDALFMRYFPKLKRFLTGLTGSSDDAEDMAQDIFLKIWINRHTLPPIENLNSYLFQMARNSAYTHFDRQQRMGEFLRQTPQMEGGEPHVSIEEELFAADLEALIECAIQQMPPQRRQVFILSRREYLSNDQIAQQLSISKRTVETHISLAICDLRKVVFLLFCTIGM